MFTGWYLDGQTDPVSTEKTFTPVKGDGWSDRTYSYRVDGFLGELTRESEQLFSNAADGSAAGTSITLPKGFYVVEWGDSLGQTAVGTTGDKRLSFRPSKGAGWKTTTYYAVVDGTVFDHNGNKRVENMDRPLFPV